MNEVCGQRCVAEQDEWDWESFNEEDYTFCFDNCMEDFAAAWDWLEE